MFAYRSSSRFEAVVSVDGLELQSRLPPDPRARQVERGRAEVPEVGVEPVGRHHRQQAPLALAGRPHAGDVVDDVLAVVDEPLQAALESG